MNLNKKEHSMSQTIRKSRLLSVDRRGRIVLALVAIDCSMLFRPSQTYFIKSEPANSSFNLHFRLLGWLFASFMAHILESYLHDHQELQWLHHWWDISCGAVTNMIISPFLCGLELPASLLLLVVHILAM